MTESAAQVNNFHLRISLGKTLASMAYRSPARQSRLCGTALMAAPFVLLWGHA
jgi:hypothetical protein